jgi:hypothetical protein
MTTQKHSIVDRLSATLFLLAIIAAQPDSARADWHRSTNTFVSAIRQGVGEPGRFMNGESGVSDTVSIAGALGEGRAWVLGASDGAGGYLDEPPYSLRVFASASSWEGFSSAQGYASAALGDDVFAFATDGNVDIGELIARTEIGNLVVRVTGIINGSNRQGNVGATLVSFDFDGNAFDSDSLFERSADYLPIDETLVVALPLHDLPFISLRMGLEAGATAGEGAVHGSVFVDFTGTMEIQSFNFYDSQGNFVDGIGVRGDSGAIYPVNVAIPEPTGLVLLTTVAGLGIVYGRTDASRYLTGKRG